ncbi:MAG: hypothetical protein GC204_03730 [Chloroflexi bacterium]|nr:hypothetical protein [Chloroflexota bacterium]
MMQIALDGIHTGAAPSPQLLQAIAATIQILTQSGPGQQRLTAPPPEWHPKPNQIWRREDHRTGERVTAWDHYVKTFDKIPFDKRPYAHQLRTHPDMAQFYAALCVTACRNRARGESPASITELFPSTTQARGGGLAKLARAQMQR